MSEDDDHDDDIDDVNGDDIDDDNDDDGENLAYINAFGGSSTKFPSIHSM